MDLIESVMSGLEDIGFETPTPIQVSAIPSLLSGRDILGQAQTGTGKTAAFALPILSMINPHIMDTQALVLVPTRELALQLTDAFLQYSSRMSRVSVLAVYGGQDYREQLRRLRGGAHIVVGTPGRVMDHIRRGTLKLDKIQYLVLDEADEMLQMGFIDDISWILEQTPEERQTALFSATLPLPIRKIAQRYMKSPEEIIMKNRVATAPTINQRYISVNQSGKVDALARVIEAEQFDGMLVFVRTKAATIELVESLEARGYAAEALNGDIKQIQRERTVERFKEGKLDILVATDVAARGLDVDRISHVINYDIPHDTETYIHRVGRTGRAGRSGEAILFATYKEKRMLDAIERATKQRITQMDPPSAKVINEKRIAVFKEKMTSIIKNQDLSFFTKLLKEYQEENDVSPLEMAAALAKQIQGDTPFLMAENTMKTVKKTTHIKTEGAVSAGSKEKTSRDGGSYERKSGQPMAPVVGMEKFRLEVGKSHGAKPGNIVGCIANEAGIDSDYICRLKMFDDYTTVELPSGMPPQIFQTLKKAWVVKRQLNISRIGGSEKSADSSKKRDGFKKKSSKTSVGGWKR